MSEMCRKAYSLGGLWIAGMVFGGCGAIAVRPHRTICSSVDAENRYMITGPTETSGWHEADSADPRLVPLSVQRQLPACPPEGNEEHYFRTGTFALSAGSRAKWREPGRYRLDAFRRAWYSVHLSAMGEPPLWCDARRGSTYRLLWLRTWETAISVRVDGDEDDLVLSAVELSGRNGWEPGEARCRVARRLSAAQAQALGAALRNADFWALPTVGGDSGTDGEQWVIEGRTPKAYHVVDRWSPDGGAYLELGKLFLELAGYRER